MKRRSKIEVRPGGEITWLSYLIEGKQNLFGTTDQNHLVIDEHVGLAKGAATRYDSPAQSLPIALYMGQP